MKNEGTRWLVTLCSYCGYLSNMGMGYRYVNEESEFVKPLQGLAKGNWECKKCGRLAPVRDDLYDFVKESFEILRGLSLPEIISLKDLLTRLKNNPSDIDAESRVASTRFDYRKFKEYKPTTLPEAQTYLLIILTIIQILTAALESNKEPDINVVNNYIFNSDSLEKEKTKGFKKISKNGSYIKKAPSKNAPCPCGSGKIFKRCHGLNK